MMDGCAFCNFKNTTQYHYKAWKSQDILKYNSNCVKEEIGKEKVIYI